MLSGIALRRLGRRGAPAAVALAVFLLIATTVEALHDARLGAGEHAAAALGNVARGAEQEVVHSLRGYDLLLQAVAEGARDVEQPLSPLSDKLLHAGGADGLFGSILLADASGRVVRATRPDAIGRDLAGEIGFSRHRDVPGLGLVAGDVAPGPHSRRLQVAVSRRLTDGYGGFAGITIGHVKLDALGERLAGYTLEPGARVTLLSLDGRLLASVPAKDNLIGQDFSAAPIMQRLQREGPGRFAAKSRSGEDRLYEIRRVAGLPFYVVASIPTRGVYAEWELRVWETGGSLLVFLLLLGAIGLALRRELWRRARAERRAAANAAMLQLMADSSEDLILKIDWSGRRQFVSRSCERMLGRPIATLLGGNFLEWVHDEDRPRLVAMLAAMQAEGMAGEATYRIRHGSGVWRQFEARGRPLPDGAGAIFVARDVTDRLAHEAQARQAQRMEALGRFTGGAAHEFNNALQAQTGALELLLEELAPGTLGRLYAATALSSGERVAQLTHSLLAFAGKQVLRPMAVDMAGLLARVEVLLAPSLPPAIALRTSLEAALPAVQADPAQLETALMELCRNAADAMEEAGGTLLIEACRGAGVAEVPAGVEAQSCLVLAVSDEGRGMTAETLARACEPFFSGGRLGQRAGLGLSMVNGFVAQTGGALHVASWPGVGTRAELWLPLAPAIASAMPSTVIAHASTSRGCGRRLLLVDDHADIRDLLADTLGQAGFEVACAASGDAALAMLSAGAPCDVLVTDYVMGGMTGGQLIAEARRRRPALRALLITGHAEPQMCGTLPPDVGMLHKPFRTGELLARLAVLAAPSVPGDAAA